MLTIVKMLSRHSGSNEARKGLRRRLSLRHARQIDTSMKILIAHNAYQQRGGEDMVAAAEVELLRSYGNQVELYQRDNRELEVLPRVAAAVSSLWSRKSMRELDRLCDEFRPDVIHAHNTFPLISPSLYWCAGKRGLPVIQTLHNFRLVCPQAMFLREHKVCEDCLGKIPWRAVTRKCYRDSAAQSAVVASMVAGHRALGTFNNRVDGYIALSNFSRDKFIAGGLPAKRIHIKPNFVKSNRVPDWSDRNGGVFVGRLSAEKGVEVLLEAARRLQGSASLRVVGSGPLDAPVRELFGAGCLGFRSRAEVFELLHASAFLVAPSTCYETFGLAAVEAFSCGVPVIASAHGGIGELVEDGVTGLLFKPGDAADLASKIAWATQNRDAMKRMGQAAYAEYLRKFTPENNYEMLMSIYQHTISATSGGKYAA